MKKKDDGFGAAKRKSGSKILLIALIAVFTIIVVAVLSAWIYYKTVFNRMILPDTVESVIPPDQVPFYTDEPTDSENWDEPPDTDDATSESSGDVSSEPYDSDDETSVKDTVDPGKIEWPDSEGLGDDGLINILLVGQDTNNFKNRSRTDTMMLISVNPNTGGISMISFLRDLYVQLGKYGNKTYQDNRLNVAYPAGGFDFLFKVIKLNFGITCDYGVVVNFDSFMNIIDMLGGVEIELTQAEVNYLKKNVPGQFPKKYPTADSVNVTKGKNLLPCEIALTYARARKIDSDFGRTGRQRKVMLSIYNRFKTANLATILDVVNMVTGISRPGEDSWVGLYKMTATELISLVTKLYPLIGNEIQGYSVPSKGSYKYASIRGMSVILPDLVKIRNDLRKQLPLDGNHDIPSVTTKKSSTPAPETTKIPETSATETITDSVPVTESIQDTVTDPPGTSDETPVTDPPPDTATDSESGSSAEETMPSAPGTESSVGGETNDGTPAT